MRVKTISVGFGTLFGFLLCWGTFGQPDAIRRMLLLEDAYLYLMFASAVAVGAMGVRLVHRLRDMPLPKTKPERRHVVGAAIFGAGWAVSDACPGPIATQLGRGFGWSLCTAGGIVLGILLYLRRQESADRSRAEFTFASRPESSSTVVASSSARASLMASSPIASRRSSTGRADFE